MTIDSDVPQYNSRARPRRKYRLTICDRHGLCCNMDGSCAQCDREAEILGESYKRSAITYRRDIQHPLGQYERRAQ